MSVYVFIGPTLRPQEVRDTLDAVCLPPVVQGDIHRVVARRPRAIGIVDGYFSGAPAVWHKEILWALAHGIPVFGSASMGALRAAELQRFGMRGVGAIFEAFRDGTLEDDDEVAVVHGPAETGFLAASEPMVNIRATLVRAQAEGVISAGVRERLERRAKLLHFPLRDWSRLLSQSADDDPRVLAALRAWLPEGRVDQKRSDALAMLAAMRTIPASADTQTPGFRFHRTHFWDEMEARARAAGQGLAPPDARQRAVLEELRLEGPKVYRTARIGGLARWLVANRGSVDLPEGDPHGSLVAFRAEHGLFNRPLLDAWLSGNGLRPADLESLIRDEARIDALLAGLGPALDRLILDHLRTTGDYARLDARARRKQAALAGRDAPRTSAAETIARRLWCFERRWKRPFPDDLDGCIRDLGFADIAEFDGSLEREWIYSNIEIG